MGRIGRLEGSINHGRLRGSVWFAGNELGADFEQATLVQDSASGLKAIHVQHSTRLGPAFGGIRRAHYETEQDAWKDACRLAAMMSYKCAMAGLPAGGAKTVVLNHGGLKRQAAYVALGEYVESLGGRYVCGPDVGTGDEELGFVRSRTGYVNPGGNDPGASTARGVLAGIRGVLEYLDGDGSFSGRRFCVQGLGSVGLAVSRQLLGEGAIVSGHDPDSAAAQRAAAVGVQVVQDDPWTRQCDVFVPCALGGVLTAEAVRDLRARGVCGSANNQLQDESLATLMRERGIVYAPDFVVNAGAVTEGVFTIQRGATDAVRREAARHIDGVQSTVLGLLREAESSGVSAHEAAMHEAKRRLDAKRPI